MGWHKIDPQTGEPAKDAHSALSREPDFVLLERFHFMCSGSRNV